MATKESKESKESKETEVKAEGRVLKQCPDCSATMFQGPFTRGPIVNDVFVKREELYQCVNCHRVWPLAELHDHEVPA